MAKLTIEQVKNRLFKTHGNTVSLDESTYVGVRTKCRFIHIQYGEWWSRPYHIFQGSSHPKGRGEKISKSKILPIEEVIKRLFNKHGDLIELDRSTYINTETKCRFVHINYGEWWAKPQDVLRGRSHPKGGEEKRKKTCLKIYGFDHPNKSDDVKNKLSKANTFPIDKIKKRLFEKHGDRIYLDELTYINMRTKSRFIHAQYGEWWATPESVLRGSSHIQDGIKKRIKSRTIPVEEIIKRLFEKHGDSIKLDATTYFNIMTKAKFIDVQYGEWWAAPDSILHGHGHVKRSNEKSKQTFLKNYGVDNPSKNIDIALKVAKSSNYIAIKYHWKTNEELVCQGSYEAKVVDCLNDNQIDFKWQPKTFTMPSGKTYRPDLYLIEEDRWVEIKGYMRKDAQEKWDWFVSQYPNSELWNKSKLEELGIL
jgi:signal peptidase I